MALDAHGETVLKAREIDRDEQHAAKDHLPDRRLDADEVHDVLDERDDNDRGKHARQASDATAEARAAENRAGEDHENRAFAEIGDGRLQAAHFQHAAYGRSKARNRKAEDLGAMDFHAGEERRFLEDGDEVTLRGWCERDGFARIGFGDCTGVVLPASTPSP